MRFLSLMVLAAACLPAVAVAAGDKTADGKYAVKPAQATAPAGAVQSSDGRWWYRTANGQLYVWTPSRWVVAPEGAAPPVQRTARRYSYGPQTVVSYPDEDSRNVFFGIDWYLNGRGPFSD